MSTKTEKSKKAESKSVAAPAEPERNDENAQEGTFVDIVSGDHEGRRGVYESTATRDPATGLPDEIVVRTRDERSELLTVYYEDARPAHGYQGGR